MLTATFGSLANSLRSYNQTVNNAEAIEASHLTRMLNGTRPMSPQFRNFVETTAINGTTYIETDAADGHVIVGMKNLFSNGLYASVVGIAHPYIYLARSQSEVL